MPTLLQINVTANSGSHGKIAEEIGQLAILKGWRSIIAYGRWANPSQSELIRIGGDFNIKEHAVESRLFDNHGLASKCATKRFIQQIKEIKPDVIHLHNIHGYYINYQMLFEYLNTTNIPIVWTLHDCWTFTGHCAHFVTAGCDKWKVEGCHHCPLKKEYPASLFLDRSGRNYRLKKEMFTCNMNLHIVTVSEWLAGLVRQSFFKDKNIRVIYNGVDLNVFKPINITENRKYSILGVCNVWTEDKGLYDFYRLREMLDTEKFEIVLIGLTNEQIQELPYGIKGLVRTNSMTELALLYNKADVVLSLSKAETFGMTIAEGKACGTPAIVYNNTAHPELVDPATGYVVENGNVDAVYKRIQEIKSKGRFFYKDACRRRAEENFDKNKCFQKYVDLYESLMQK